MIDRESIDQTIRGTRFAVEERLAGGPRYTERLTVEP
jgi:hypothetical protein